MFNIFSAHADNLLQINRQIHSDVTERITNQAACTTCGRGYFNVTFHGNICVQCHKTPRKFTEANDLYVSAETELFQDLSAAERMLIRPIVPQMMLIRTSDGQQAIRGHTIFFHQEITTLMRRLPRTSVPIVIVSRTRFDGRVSALRVRRSKVLQCFNFLKANNRYYQHMDFDDDAYTQLPDDGFIPPLDHILVENDEDEPYVDVSLIADNGRADGVTGGDVINLRINETVLRHPPMGSDPVNEFNQPGLMSLAFCDLFPYAEGLCILFNIFN